MRVPKTPPPLSNARETYGLLAMGHERTAEVVREAQQKYRHWDKVHRIARSAGIDQNLVWFALKFLRNSPQPTPFTDTQNQVLTYNLPPVVQRELMLVDQHLAGYIGLDHAPALRDEDRDRFIINALMEEAISSSMLEGAVTTVAEAKNMLRRKRPARTNSEQMVINNYHAMSLIRDSTGRELTPDFLLELQELLTHGTLDDPSHSGRFRRDDEQVRVSDQYGEIMHTPPSAYDLPARLEKICNFANRTVITEDESFIHPVIRAMLLHFQLAYDHPFCDGNGRTARAIFYWSMLRAGYWLFEFLPISRFIHQSPAQYARAFLYTETDDFDGTYFLMYHTAPAPSPP